MGTAGLYNFLSSVIFEMVDKALIGQSFVTVGDITRFFSSRSNSNHLILTLDENEKMDNLLRHFNGKVGDSLFFLYFQYACGT